MRGDHAIVQKANSIQIDDRAGAFRFDAVVNFAFRFFDVRDDWRAGPIGKRARGFQMILGDSVRSVRRNRRHNQSIALPLFHEAFDIGQAFLIRLVIGYRKINHRFAQNSAHACFESLVGNCIFEVVHIAVGRRATANHLSQTQARAHPHEVLCHVFGFCRKNVFRQPFLQIEIVRDAAKQSHRHVGMAIDETGNNDLSIGVDDFGSRIVAIYIGSFRNRNDAPTFHRNAAVFNDATSAVHGNHGSASND